MRKRRSAQVSDDSDDGADGTPLTRRRAAAETPSRRPRKKRLRVDDDDEDYEDENLSENNPKNNNSNNHNEKEEAEVEETVQEDARPIGEAIKVSGKGKGKKLHFAGFEFDGNEFKLEDPVLLTPDDSKAKPYVAIIKDITQKADGSIWVTGQWFYRPEEAERKGGGNWEARDTRELYYSFHLDDVPAESVMHKCVVHFVPLNKKFPIRSQHPGFIVQKVYDTVAKTLWKLTDKDYEDSKQHEIDLLVQKTRDRIGELPDVDPDDAPFDRGDAAAIKHFRRKPMRPLDVSRTDDVNTRVELKPETPGSCAADVSEYRTILEKHEALTGDKYRDKWLDKLLQSVKVACKLKDETSLEDKKVDNAASINKTDNNADKIGTTDKDNSSNDGESIYWPDAAVRAVTALEHAAHEALVADFQKYNQKMRKLEFNLKNNALLAKRMLNKELDPLVILNMSPDELKEGLTAEERRSKEPEEPKHLQMTDARCSRCSEKKVAIADIIQAGVGDRYQLECIACGYTWYGTRDAISTLTIDAPSAAGNVGTAPWATAKFEAVEKVLVSPRDSEKPAADVFRKSTAAYMPVLEAQKSFKSKTEDASVPVSNPE